MPVHTVSRPSAHSAVQACGSIGACCAPAQVQLALDHDVGVLEPCLAAAVQQAEAVAGVAVGVGAQVARVLQAAQLVHQRRALGERVLRLVDAGQLVVLHQDELGRGARRPLRRGGDGGDRLADVPDGPLGQHVLVADDAAVAGEVADVLGQQADCVGGHAARVDGHHPRGCERRPHQPCVQLRGRSTSIA